MSDLGMNIAISGMIAQTDAMNVTANNITNASTTGYSREQADLVTSPSIPVPSLQSSGTVGEFGTGVDVQTVTRVRDQFLDTQYRQQNTLLGESQQQSDALSQVETVFGDLSSTTGLNTDLNNFWQAWDTLSQEPENLPERTSLAETATTLADDLQSTQGQLTTLQGNLNTDISNDVSHINDDLQQIAGLNNTIQSATISGLSPNDLLDQRDNLLDDLSTYVNAKTVTNSDNTVTLSIGGATVVAGSIATPLATTTDSNGNYQVGVSLGNGQSDSLEWSTLGGALYGLQQARDVDVQGYQDQLNQLTSTVAGAVNSLHETGYGLDGTTGIPFFVNDSDASNPEDTSNITAANIAVNPNIVNDPQEIAAAASGVTQSTTTTQGSASGTAQVETLAIGSGATENETLQVVVTAAGMSGSPITVDVPVTAGETADDVAADISDALSANQTVGGNGTGSGFFTVSTDGSDVVLTANTDAANDSTMNASVAGLAATTQSTTTTQGSASSAAQVETLAIGSGATANETLQVVVTAAGMNNSPKTISVAVNSGDSAATIAGDIATALDDDPDVGAADTGFFTVSTDGSDVVLTANTAADNDSTMSASVSGLVAPGDGSNALGIFNLSTTDLNFPTGNGSGTISDTADNFYDSMISDLGVASSQANNDVTNQNTLVTSLNNSRQSVSGVSLDEEMTNMVQEQSAYEAAAKLINVIADMMQTVIGIGSTGGLGS